MDLKVDYEDNHWKDRTGSLCMWCGKHVSSGYLYPVVVCKREGNTNFRSIQSACLECIAFERVPSDVAGWAHDTPLYDKNGMRIGRLENKK